jgi:hypothetical protein
MNTLSSTIVYPGGNVLAGCWVKQADELAFNNLSTCMNNTCLTTTKLLCAYRWDAAFTCIQDPCIPTQLFLLSLYFMGSSSMVEEAVAVHGLDG